MKILLNSRHASKSLEDVIYRTSAKDYTVSDLWTLARSDDALTRCRAVYSEKCPTDLMEYLLDDTSDVVLCALADSKYTDPDILDILAHNEKYHVRAYVVTNPNTSKDTLVSMLNDASYSIQRDAKRRLDAGMYS